MKKHLLLFVIAFITSAAIAQDNNLYSFMFHKQGTEYFYNLHNVMQQRDGDLAVYIYVLENYGDPYMGSPFGNMFCKISPATLTITDSVFMEDTTQRTFLMGRDPRGEGNIRANFEYHEDCDSSFLRISHFTDSDLHSNPEEDIVTPVCEGYIWNVLFSTLFDCRGDLIMKYHKERPDGIVDVYIARFGPDGTLKHQALLSENVIWDDGPFRVFKESPLQYYQWEEIDTEDLYGNLGVIVMDSLFHKNTKIFNKILREETLDSLSLVKAREYLVFHNYETEVIPIGGDDILVAASYHIDTNFNGMTAEYGVAVAKYDARTMQLKDYVAFNDHTGYYNRGQCMGLWMMTDSTVYFAYKEHPDPEESVTIVKMDTDLNVEWKRLCKTGDINMSPLFYFLNMYEDEQGNEKGIVWSGYGIRTSDNKPGLVHFFLNHDGTVGVGENDVVEVRPYACYPNPAHDALHLQYSPDVQPKQIELYDLQGRLVRTQNDHLESLSLQGLAAGQYVMKVTMEGGDTFTDKVVKE